MKYLIVFFIIIQIAFSIDKPNHKNTIVNFLENMTSGKSIFFLDNGIMQDGILITKYKIKKIKNDEINRLIVIVQYEQIGEYKIDEHNYKFKNSYLPSPIVKTALYHFKVTKKNKLDFSSSSPSAPLILKKYTMQLKSIKK